MDGVSGVGGFTGGGMPIRPTLGQELTGTPAPSGQASLAGVGADQSITSISSTAITMSSDSMVALQGAAASNNELLGAVLLLLILQYLRSQDGQEKQGLLDMMTAIASQQQQGAGGTMLMYNSSMLNIESTNITAMSGSVGLDAYAGDAALLQQAPSIDPGSSSLDVIA